MSDLSQKYGVPDQRKEKNIGSGSGLKKSIELNRKIILITDVSTYYVFISFPRTGILKAAPKTTWIT